MSERRAGVVVDLGNGERFRGSGRIDQILSYIDGAPFASIANASLKDCRLGQGKGRTIEIDSVWIDGASRESWIAAVGGEVDGGG